MKTNNPWPPGSIDEPKEGYECVYADLTGVKKYAPKPSEKPEEKPKKDK